MVLGVLFFVSIGGFIFYALRSFKEVVMNVTPEGVAITQDHQPTDFAEQGRLRFLDPADPQGQAILLYKQSQSQFTNSIPVVFTTKTLCATRTGTLPCMAMSATRDVAFGDRPVTIDGRVENGRVLIYKLDAYDPGEVVVQPVAGTVYVDWEDAAAALKACRVRVVSDNRPQRIVRLTMRDTSETWEAWQPLESSLNQTLVEAESRCGLISRLNV